jgi:hypothetical protein
MWEYRFYTDNTARQDIETHYPSRFVAVFNTILTGACKVWILDWFDVSFGILGLADRTQTDAMSDGRMSPTGSRAGADIAWTTGRQSLRPINLPRGLPSIGVKLC